MTEEVMEAGDSGEQAQLIAAQAATVNAELEGMSQAIAGYDEILWKIRAGYFGILYGALTIFLGTGGLISASANGPALPASLKDTAFSFTTFALIVGFSVAAFFVDFAYLRKKLKVVVVRDRLINVAYNGRYAEDADTVNRLLCIAGEAQMAKLPPDCRGPYLWKRNWNLAWIHFPLYATAPAMAALVSRVL